MKKSFDPQVHVYVPKHEILKEEEAIKLLKRYNISKKQLPRMAKSDPVVKFIGAKIGDVIKITRKSPTTVEAETYRVVVNA